MEKEGEFFIACVFMKFEKISDSDLISRQVEVFNFQNIAGLLADYGFNCIKLADDYYR